MSILDVLSDYKREMNIEGKLSEVNIINRWQEIAGRAIASRTTKLYIRDGVLYIHLSSSVVRSELMMMRESIRSRMNDAAGSDLIKEIVLR
jgi:predicted nucleic acid-binding Zn ribbon protein